MCGCLQCAPPTGELTRIPGMCPDWELNQRPFGSQAGTQSTEPHQPRLNFCSVTVDWTLEGGAEKKKRLSEVNVDFQIFDPGK